jgi:hypothetical protein
LKLFDQLCAQITEHEQSMHIEITYCQGNVPKSKNDSACMKRRQHKKNDPVGITPTMTNAKNPE